MSFNPTFSIIPFVVIININILVVAKEIFFAVSPLIGEEEFYFENKRLLGEFAPGHTVKWIIVLYNY